MQFCLLSQNDTKALLDFEISNKDWFEATIEKREDDFYRIEAVEVQIDNFLTLFKNKQMYPALIKSKSGAILARANLRLNNKGYNTFGYRVSEIASGQGVATFATEQILKIAKEEFNLNKISAFVSTDNLASAKVLSKFGFVIASFHPEMALVGQQLLDCHLYQLAL